MAMLITNVRQVWEQASELGWKMFCDEQAVDPNRPDLDQDVMIDSFDLLRYEMSEAHRDLRASVNVMKGELFAGKGS